MTTATPEAPAFDPADHNVEEVIAYLDDAAADEADRVQAVEAAGKDRATIREWTSSTNPTTPNPSGNPDAPPAEDDGTGTTESRPGPSSPSTGEEPVETGSGDEKATWDVRTHGKPNARQRRLYEVVGE